MGNSLLKAVTKPIRTFNVDNRARRVIEKDKPSMAPRHKTDRSTLPTSVQSEIKDKVLAKSNLLDERLRSLKVTSDGVNPEIPSDKSSLPRLRDPPNDNIYGFGNPKVVPVGKITLAQALELLTKHNDNPSKYQAVNVAKDYNISSRDAELILEYYMPLTVVAKDKDGNVEPPSTNTPRIAEH